MKINYLSAIIVASSLLFCSSPHIHAQSNTTTRNANTTIINRPNLSVGSQGEFVRELQAALKLLGFYDSVVDGIYGQSTAIAVSQFQEVALLNATGLVNQQTWNTLFPIHNNSSEPSTITVVTSPPSSTSNSTNNSNSNSTVSVATSPPSSTSNSNSTDNNSTNTSNNNSSTVTVETSPPSSTSNSNSTDSNSTNTSNNSNSTSTNNSNSTNTSNNSNSNNTSTSQPNTDINGSNSNTNRVENLPILREGDEGENVRLLQEKLKELDFYNGAIDGVFGRSTLAAVIAAQTDFGLDGDGIVGRQTWEKLYDNSSSSNNTSQSISNSAIRVEDLPLLKEGNEGDSVRLLQEKLKELGFYDGDIDGVFGRTTLEAVIAAQTDFGVDGDGIVGRQTWEKLYDNSSNSSTTNTTSNTSSNSTAIRAENLPVLREGDEGENVRLLQEKLKQLGFYNGAIDGDFGNNTLQAVMAAQIYFELDGDGVVGRQTWENILGE